MSQKKNIVIIQNTELFSERALSVYLTSFIRNLFKYKDPELDFSIISGGSQTARSPNQQIPFEHVEISTRLYSPWENVKFTLLAFRALLRGNSEQKIDIIHCFYPNSSLIAAVLFKIFVRKRVKLIYDVRSPWIDMIFSMEHINPVFKKFLHWPLYLAERILVKFVDCFIFVSEGLSNFYQENFNLPKSSLLYILPSAVDLSLFRQDWPSTSSATGPANGGLTLGYVGVLTKARRLDVLIRYFRDVHEEMPNTKLFLVGDGKEKDKLERLAAELGIENALDFLGLIPHAEIPKLMQQFDFGISHYPPNLVFNFNHPLKILEYLAVGVPVLASNIPSHRSLAREFDMVHVYSTPQDILGIVKGSQRYHSPDLTKYSWQSSIDNYNKIYFACAT